MLSLIFMSFMLSSASLKLYTDFKYFWCSYSFSYFALFSSPYSDPILLYAYFTLLFKFVIWAPCYMFSLSLSIFYIAKFYAVYNNNF